MAPNWPEKKARGKCAVNNCRNELPPSAKVHRRKICSKCHTLRWRANNPISAVLAALRQRSKRKQIPFALTFAHLSALCEESGYLKERGRQRHQLHLDRKIVELGYVDGNIQVLTCSENTIKGNQERKSAYGNAWRGAAAAPPVIDGEDEPDEEDPF
jgi:hypothetical protein